MAFRNQTGGLELLSTESSEPTHISLRVKEKGSSTTGIGTLIVNEGPPPTVKKFSVRALPPGATPVNLTLDGALRKQMIEGVNGQPRGVLRRCDAC